MKLEKIVLKTERLVLRTIEISDIDSLVENINDKTVARYTTNIPHPYTKKDAKWFVNHVQERLKEKKGYQFSIEIDGNIVGGVGLSSVDWKNKNAELGYWIGRKYRRKGYMTEAVKRMLEFGFKELKLEKIYATTFHPNKASANLLRKAGFKQEGRRKKHLFKNSRWYDQLEFGLLKEEYKK